MDLSQEELAKLCGVSRQTISAIEKGDYNPTISLCIAINVLYALITGTAVPGWSSLILSIWLVGGFILISVGITGVYIGKIYNEVKHRPLYNIQDIL